MQNSYPLCRARQRNIKRSHTLPLLVDDASGLNHERSIYFETLDELHWNDRHLPIET